MNAHAANESTQLFLTQTKQPLENHRLITWIERQASQTERGHGVGYIQQRVKKVLQRTLGAAEVRIYPDKTVTDLQGKTLVSATNIIDFTSEQPIE